MHVLTFTDITPLEITLLERSFDELQQQIWLEVGLYLAQITLKTANETLHIALLQVELFGRPLWYSRRSSERLNRVAACPSE